MKAISLRSAENARSEPSLTGAVKRRTSRPEAESRKSTAPLTGPISILPSGEKASGEKGEAPGTKGRLQRSSPVARFQREISRALVRLTSFLPSGSNNKL